MNNLLKRVVAVGSIFCLSLMSTVNAAVIAGADTAVTKIGTDGIDTISAIGGAMIGMAVVAVVFKWAKASLFG